MLLHTLFCLLSTCVRVMFRLLKPVLLPHGRPILSPFLPLIFPMINDITLKLSFITFLPVFLDIHRKTAFQRRKGRCRSKYGNYFRLIDRILFFLSEIPVYLLPFCANATKDPISSTLRHFVKKGHAFLMKYRKRTVSILTCIPRRVRWFLNQ